jgi:predicted MFS family arabinose efflux permease
MIFILGPMLVALFVAIASPELVAKTVRAEHSTEAFTWSASSLLAGVGIGLAAGGLLLEQFRSGATLATAAVSALLAALGARFVLGRLREEG